MTCLGSAIGYGVSWTLQRKDGYGASLHRQCNGLQNCKLQKQGDGGAPAVLGLSIFLVSPLIAPLSPCPKIRSLHCNAATVSTTQRTAEERVATLSEALPFIQRFQGKTVVVKYGGAAMKDETLMDGVIKDLVLLSCVGLKPIFVHGGGPEINQLLGKLNIESKFQNGLRVTDAATMEVVQMVLVGKVNKSLVSLIHRVGGTAVGLSGIDGRLITAEPLDSALGFVGRVTSINRMVLDGVMKDGCIPVIATVASDGMGRAYNVNADIAAGEIAATLGAEKLILMTDVPGLLTNPKDPDTLVRTVDVAGVKTLIADGVISGGMIPKVDCCMNALAKGVHATHIIDGRLPHSLLLEILTNEGAGTMINA